MRFAAPTIGGLAALATLPIHLVASASLSQQLAALTLCIVAAIYIGFALADGKLRWIVAEAIVVSAYLLAALLTLSVSMWVAVAAFTLHGLWDLAHHRHIRTAMPRWYIPFCAVFDWVFAGGLAGIILLKTGTNA